MLLQLDWLSWLRVVTAILNSDSEYPAVGLTR